MNEPMDREELIDAIATALQWMVLGDEDGALGIIPLSNGTIQRNIKEALSFLSALRALEVEPHGV